jgi:hypothetical protein
MDVVDNTNPKYISRKSIAHLINAGANPHQKCRLNFDVYHGHEEESDSTKVTTINQFIIRRKIGYSRYEDNSSPAQLLALFNTDYNYLEPSNQSK